MRFNIYVNRMSFACQSHVICMLFVCAHILSVSTHMPSLCHQHVLVWHPYVSRMYSSSVCHSYVLVCHPYVTRMYLHVIRMPLACSRMSSVCHSHVLVCHPYVARMYLYVIRKLLRNSRKILTSLRFCEKKLIFHYLQYKIVNHLSRKFRRTEIFTRTNYGDSHLQRYHRIHHENY